MEKLPSKQNQRKRKINQLYWINKGEKFTNTFSYLVLVVFHSRQDYYSGKLIDFLVVVLFVFFRFLFFFSIYSVDGILSFSRFFGRVNIHVQMMCCQRFLFPFFPIYLPAVSLVYSNGVRGLARYQCPIHRENSQSTSRKEKDRERKRAKWRKKKGDYVCVCICLTMT